VDPLILVVSNAADATADFFEDRLRLTGHDYLRVNSDDFATSALTIDCTNFRWHGTFSMAGTTVDVDQIAAIYYRRPQVPPIHTTSDAGTSSWMQSELRSAWGGLLAARTDITWLNHPLAISAASYKPEQIARATRAGLDVPDTLITTDPGRALTFCTSHSWQVITKPLGHGAVVGASAAGDRVVYTNQLDSSNAMLLDRVTNCATLLQRQIDKTIDIRATVVGTECIAVALHSQDRTESMIDCRRNNMDGMRYSLISLLDSLADRLITYTRSYGLMFAAIDLILDKAGTYWFLELNAAGQWAWLEQLADAPISGAIVRALRGGRGR
jgi:glutathione synthase/RimK-type ligase-like ATP-grasp enzyme